MHHPYSLWALAVSALRLLMLTFVGPGTGYCIKNITIFFIFDGLFFICACTFFIVLMMRRAATFFFERLVVVGVGTAR